MKYALATLAVIASTACAQAATVTETAVGGFSGIATTPTVISAGTTVIQGSGAADAYDIFQINGLAPGAQTLTLDFTGPTGVGPSFAAGGSVLSKTSPFQYNWDGTSFAAFGLFGDAATDQLILTLDPSFAGQLYLGLYFTYGSNIAYTISLPAALDASVPIPASGGLALLAILALSLAGHRNTRSR